MERLNVRILLLELTRQCNLECMHCFRGDSENKYMKEEIIEKIFNNIARINTLLLTGGEPLLAINQLKKITDILSQDKMNIKELIIVTNGSVLTDELINMFFIMKEKTNLQIRISSDKFHMLELKKNNLEENIKFLKQYFNVIEESPNDKVYIIDKIGRAVNLTKEDIDYINSIGDKTTKYMLGNKKILEKFRNEYPLPKLIEDNVVDGSLNIDVYGNITPTYYSFKSEDENIYSNVRGNKTLKKAISNIKSM
ncbi:MAG: 4Fe-4S cluster-binding domain-containing protein [Bacilli bacterium]|nr:4Fe-4S cluster-binding domain-containing protein [Bacilli bacterium]